MKDDLETVTKTIWIARDLSIRVNGEVPEEVTRAPAALQNLLRAAKEGEKK